LFDCFLLKVRLYRWLDRHPSKSWSDWEQSTLSASKIQKRWIPIISIFSQIQELRPYRLRFSFVLSSKSMRQFNYFGSSQLWIKCLYRSEMLNRVPVSATDLNSSIRHFCNEIIDDYQR
jgi:hypothetical protein